MKRLVLIVALLCSTSIFAEGLKMDNLKVNKVGVRLGLRDGTLGFGLIMPMGKLYKDFMFATTFDYVSVDSVTQIGLGLRGSYHLKDVKLMPKMKTYVGGGLAIHTVSAGASSGSTNLGIDMFAGVGYQINKKMCVKGESGYRMAGSGMSHLVLSGAFVYSFR